MRYKIRWDITSLISLYLTEFRQNTAVWTINYPGDVDLNATMFKAFMGSMQVRDKSIVIVEVISGDQAEMLDV